MGLVVVGQERPEWPEVEVQVFWSQPEMVPELGHPALERHERGADPLYLLVAERALINSAQSLALHQLPQQFHDGEDQADQPAFYRLRIGIDPMTRRQRALIKRVPGGGHRAISLTSAPDSAKALTDVTSARSEMVTMSTSATDRVISPATTTPPARTRSSRSTRAIRSLGTAVACVGRR